MANNLRDCPVLTHILTLIDENKLPMQFVEPVRKACGLGKNEKLSKATVKSAINNRGKRLDDGKFVNNLLASPENLSQIPLPVFAFIAKQVNDKKIEISAAADISKMTKNFLDKMPGLRSSSVILASEDYATLVATLPESERKEYTDKLNAHTEAFKETLRTTDAEEFKHIEAQKIGGAKEYETEINSIVKNHKKFFKSDIGDGLQEFYKGLGSSKDWRGIAAASAYVYQTEQIMAARKVLGIRESEAPKNFPIANLPDDRQKYIKYLANMGASVPQLQITEQEAPNIQQQDVKADLSRGAMGNTLLDALHIKANKDGKVNAGSVIKGAVQTVGTGVAFGLLGSVTSVGAMIAGMVGATGAVIGEAQKIAKAKKERANLIAKGMKAEGQDITIQESLVNMGLAATPYLSLAAAGFLDNPAIKGVTSGLFAVRAGVKEFFAGRRKGLKGWELTKHTAVHGGLRALVSGASFALSSNVAAAAGDLISDKLGGTPMGDFLNKVDDTKDMLKDYVFSKDKKDLGSLFSQIGEKFGLSAAPQIDASDIKITAEDVRPSMVLPRDRVPGTDLEAEIPEGGIVENAPLITAEAEDTLPTQGSGTSGISETLDEIQEVRVDTSQYTAAQKAEYESAQRVLADTSGKYNDGDRAFAEKVMEGAENGDINSGISAARGLVRADIDRIIAKGDDAAASEKVWANKMLGIEETIAEQASALDAQQTLPSSESSQPVITPADRNLEEADSPVVIAAQPAPADRAFPQSAVVETVTGGERVSIETGEPLPDIETETPPQNAERPPAADRKFAMEMKNTDRTDHAVNKWFKANEDSELELLGRAEGTEDKYYAMKGDEIVILTPTLGLGNDGVANWGDPVTDMNITPAGNISVTQLDRFHPRLQRADYGVEQTLREAEGNPSAQWNGHEVVGQEPNNGAYVLKNVSTGEIVYADGELVMSGQPNNIGDRTVLTEVSRETPAEQKSAETVPGNTAAAGAAEQNPVETAVGGERDLSPGIDDIDALPETEPIQEEVSPSQPGNPIPEKRFAMEMRNNDRVDSAVNKWFRENHNANSGLRLLGRAEGAEGKYYASRGDDIVVLTPTLGLGNNGVADFGDPVIDMNITPADNISVTQLEGLHTVLQSGTDGKVGRIIRDAAKDGRQEWYGYDIVGQEQGEGAYILRGGPQNETVRADLQTVDNKIVLKRIQEGPSELDKSVSDFLARLGNRGQQEQEQGREQ